jgi:hypothetical protein
VVPPLMNGLGLGGLVGAVTATVDAVVGLDCSAIVGKGVDCSQKPLCCNQTFSVCIILLGMKVRLNVIHREVLSTLVAIPSPLIFECLHERLVPRVIEQFTVSVDNDLEEVVVVCSVFLIVGVCV